MTRTPGFVVPFSYPSEEELDKDLRRRSEAAGFTPFEPSDFRDVVKHYGVKGMHWGVRKNTPTHADYSVGQRQYDKKNYGHGGVKRINRRLNKGADLTTARKKEVKFRRRRSKAISTGVLAVRYREQIKVGAKVAGTILSLAAGVAVQAIAKKAETNRGRAAAANTMGLPSQSTAGPTFSKKNRNGAYNITQI